MTPNKGKKRSRSRHGRNIHRVRGNDFGDQFNAEIARRQVPVQSVALGFGQPSVDICRDQAQLRTRAQLFYFRLRHFALCWPDPQR